MLATCTSESLNAAAYAVSWCANIHAQDLIRRWCVSSAQAMATRHVGCVAITGVARNAAMALGFAVNVNVSPTPSARDAKHLLSLVVMDGARPATGRGDASTRVSS